MILPRRLLVAVSAAALAGTLFAAPSYATTGTHTKLVCEASTKNKVNSPAIGATTTYNAGSAGTVMVKRVDAQTLQVASTGPAAGWTPTVTANSGHRLKVTFTNSSTREMQHFGISLSARGTFVMTSTQHCHH